LSVGKIG
jgi:hypothetical protein